MRNHFWKWRTIFKIEKKIQLTMRTRQAQKWHWEISSMRSRKTSCCPTVDRRPLIHIANDLDVFSLVSMKKYILFPAWLISFSILALWLLPYPNVYTVSEKDGETVFFFFCFSTNLMALRIPRVLEISTLARPLWVGEYGSYVCHHIGS